MDHRERSDQKLDCSDRRIDRLDKKRINRRPQLKNEITGLICLKEKIEGFCGRQEDAAANHVGAAQQGARA